MKHKGWLVIVLGSLACLAIGVIWTARLDVPSPTPWWYGKKAVVHAELWEPGHTMATVAMTVPKGALDTMHALGLKTVIELDSGDRIELNKIWHKLQRLERGQKVEVDEEDGAVLTVWIDVKGNGGADTTTQGS
jgi:hypothetical protein